MCAAKSNSYGMNVHVPARLDILNRCASCGVGWIRVDFNWLGIEPAKGRFYWELTDAVLERAEALNLAVFGSLAYTPGWANGGRDRTVPPSNPADWQNFVRSVVQKYKGRIRHWGMWNEPNLQHFFTGSKEDYVHGILIPGARTAKQENPDCMILGPELAHDHKKPKLNNYFKPEQSTWAVWLKYVLENAGGEIDILTHHIYGWKHWLLGFKLGEKDMWERAFAELDPRFSGRAASRCTPLKTILNDCDFSDKEVWITEVGRKRRKKESKETWLARQAESYEEFLTLWDQCDWLKNTFFYDMIDDPDNDMYFGILEDDLTPRPAFESYARWICEHPGE